MNEKQYRSLCDACDLALLAPDSTIERVAITWLHVIREHPVFLGDYEEVIEPSKSIKAIGRKWLRIVRSNVGWWRRFGRALKATRLPWFGPKELPDRIDVLFVSHLINASHAGATEDFYFGDLPNRLVALGHPAVIALINHQHKAVASLADKWKGRSVSRLILSGSLGILEELALRFRLKKESLRLSRLAKVAAPGLARHVLARASEEALSGGSHLNLRIATQIRALAAKLKPKVIVVTHEGHAWERVVFASARAVLPDVQCIGYQHAAVFRLQHAIRRNLARQYNPDTILTAGAVSKAQLERLPCPEGIPISVLGSNRNMRRDAKVSGRPMPSNGTEPGTEPGAGRACLVIPESIPSECYLLFEFSLECARVCPEIQFIWRLHPLISFEFLMRQNTKLNDLPENVLLSRATLEEDIARSRWALYRGTTAIVHALSAGLRPIYLRLAGEMTIDPLYELEVWRTKVENISEFLKVVHQNHADGDRESIKDLESAQRYCEAYFMPPDVGKLVELISK